MIGSFLKQKVNSYLCIALIAAMAFWTCLYYFVHQTEAFGNVINTRTQISELK